LASASYIKIKDHISHISCWLNLRAKTKPWPKRIIWSKRGVLIAVAVYLGLRLTRFGWGDILAALPTSPWFYILSIVIFIVPPFFEGQSYRLITGHAVPGGLRVLNRKRVYNEAVISYAGEAYLCDKLAAITTYNHRKALIAIKDNNLVSALISNTWTIVLVAIVLLFGRADVLLKIWNLAPLLVGLFAFICLGLYGFTFVFFKKITSLPLAKLLQIGLLHCGKILAISTLQVAQWASAMPRETIQTWLLLLTVQILVKRIPGLPNADFIFLGVGLSLVGFAHGAAADVTAMLVAATAMTQIVYLAVFILTSETGGRTKTEAVGE